ncbi:hypothetical protein J4E08_12635 [Sagittula sp. NFXS13]|uniref:hypothetical protein n=1 Tax=Sagittula sp. NFXS13 TaxID=2819095 RepID=UPI0032DFE3A0
MCGGREVKAATLAPFIMMPPRSELNHPHEQAEAPPGGDSPASFNVVATMIVQRSKSTKNDFGAMLSLVPDGPFRSGFQHL